MNRVACTCSFGMVLGSCKEDVSHGIGDVSLDNNTRNSQ